MTPLFTAIYARFTGSTLATQIGNRLFQDEAPQGTQKPYAVYGLLPTITDYVMCPVPGAGMNFDECPIQFNLYSETELDSTEAGLMLTNLMALYDWCRITPTGYTAHYMRRDGQHLMRDIDNNVWQYVVDYTVLLES